MNSDNRAGNFTFHTKLTVNDNKTLERKKKSNTGIIKAYKSESQIVHKTASKRKHAF